MIFDTRSSTIEDGLELSNPDVRTPNTSVLSAVTSLSSEGVRQPSTPRAQNVSANAMPDAILSFWDSLNEAELSNQMHDRLLRIASLRSGWRGPGSQALRAESLKSFLEFWKTVHHRAADPNISLAVDGSLFLEWRKSAKQSLDIRFLGKSAVFGMLAGDRIREGVEPISEVARAFLDHELQPLKWQTT